ncbi:hypothetical protein RJ639_033087 [Escallonia herrerae]|uniref:Cytochrome P450 n=1 Tax=Escallonia herrerae TaxID=1293975 RepID=A0AA88WSW0_9ASTE|nr:hypothetical protein RJ639_033087 [Escallonia herrerae]
MGRMENLWGKDRLEFRPDRWFVEPNEGKRGELKKESLFKFPVFQAGPRVCLGKELALIQMKYVVASILKRGATPDRSHGRRVQGHGPLETTTHGQMSLKI